MGADSGSLPQAQSQSQHPRNCAYALAIRGALDIGLGSFSFRLLGAVAAVLNTRSGVSRAAVHGPARLRTWCLLPPSAYERLGWSCHRRVYADALRRLAPQPFYPSRWCRSFEAPRDRRHRDPDGTRVSSAFVLAPPSLPFVPTPAHYVRYRSRIFVRASQ